MADIEQLVESLIEDTGKIKARPAQHPFMLSLKWTGAAVLYLLISLVLSGLRPDLGKALHNFWYDAELFMLLLLFISCAISAGLLAFPDLHQKRLLALGPVVMFGLFVLLMLFSWDVTPIAPLPVHSWQCTLSITLFSVLPAGWTLYAMRKYASTHTGWAGSVAVLSAFSIGALWLRLLEVNDSIPHVLLWHYLPMLAVGLIGLVLGRKLLKW